MLLDNCCRSLFGLMLALFAVSLPTRTGFAGEASPAHSKPCLGCISIRVGIPRIVRGPAVDIADSRFTEIELPNGGFRGFDAHGETRAIDGKHPKDMGAPGRLVLRPGAPGTYDSCGQWLNHVERAGAIILGFVRDETACNYQRGQTHKSMSLATSGDHGLTWRSLGQIITGTDVPTTGRNTGEGDCTAVDGRDGYYYAYCFRARDGALIVARAPISSPGPGNWKKYFQGQWDQPGLGGDAARLMNGSGVSVARWTTAGDLALTDLALTGWVQGGLGLFFTSDRTTLTALREPLLVLDPGVWQRPAPSELIAYPVLLDAGNGSNQLSSSWMLVHAYWPPDGDRADEYLVFRDIDVSISKSTTTPQVGALLARWYGEALHDRWSTTAPVPGGGASYKLETRSGYLMTVADAGSPTVELEDCVSMRPGHPDHLLAEKGFCAARAYQRLRTAGWVYAEARPNTIPLYRCHNAQEQSHFASNAPDCEKLGVMERLLGYALKQ
jgi:hypothetical protein